jgi:hypothetical protein
MGYSEEKKYVLKNKVAKILKEKKLLQKDLIKMTGISQTQIQRICSNQTNSINKAHFTTIARALEIEDMNDLFEIVEVKKSDEVGQNVSHETLQGESSC